MEISIRRNFRIYLIIKIKSKKVMSSQLREDPKLENLPLPNYWITLEALIPLNSTRLLTINILTSCLSSKSKKISKKYKTTKLS